MGLSLAASLLLVVSAALASLYATSPPSPVPSTAPATEFSSERAMQHVRLIAREPHPTGSKANQLVRDYLLRELASLGLAPQVQTAAPVVERFGSAYKAARVDNVLARIEGVDGAGDALLLAAHYDSVPTGPGANDDAAAVAALLETARALLSQPPLRNDVVLLFTDGEEPGLFGARAFVEEHPWADDVRVAVNFEARGNSGPSAVDETSAQNARLIEALAGVPRPVASSAMFEVGRWLPYTTDLRVFKAAGMAGFNLAYFDGAVHYHTALDTPDTVDQGSLQHHGSYALALARHVGNEPLDTRVGDAVYFDLFGRFLVRYPAGWSIPLAVAVVILFVAVIFLGLRRRLLVGWRILAGSLACLIAVVLGSLSTRVLLGLVRFLTGGRPMDVSVGDVYHGDWHALGLFSAALAVAVAIYGSAARRLGAANLALGALVPWVVLAAAAAGIAPGMSFFFTWAVVLALPGLALALLLGDGARSRGPLNLVRGGVVISGVAAVALVAPSLYLLHIALTVSSAAITAAFLVLTVGLVAGHVSLLGGGQGRMTWLGAVVLGIVAVAVLAVSAVLSRFDAEHPRPDTILYALDADSGKATWATLDASPDAYTARFVGPMAIEGNLAGFLPFSPRGLLAEAPQVPLEPPALEVLEDVSNGVVRRLRLRARSPRGAENLMLWLDSDDPERDQDGPVLSAAVDGVSPPVERRGRWALDYIGLPPEGIELTFELRADVPVRIRLIDYSNGLPDVPGIDEERPPGTMPAPDPPTVTRFADATFVAKTFVLGG